MENNTDIFFNSIDNTASWQMDLIGETTNSTYRGLFVFKCFINPLDTLAAGREYRSLLGENSEEATEQEKFLAYCLSQCKYRIIKYPPFWNTESMVNGNIPDLNILTSVFTKAIDAQVQYQEFLKNKKNEALKSATEAAEKIKNEPKTSVNELNID